jgi:hypothetical protein
MSYGEGFLTLLHHGRLLKYIHLAHLLFNKILQG